MNEASNSILIRRAVSADANDIASCVKAAYEHYIVRMGKPPGPMLDDYDEVVKSHHVTVAEHEGEIVGALVLISLEDGVLLDNVAVLPTFQGKGLGKRLMQLAEDEVKSRGYSEIQLYTHEKMTENITMYTNMGYVEVSRRVVNGYDRVYMSKQLGASS